MKISEVREHSTEELHNLLEENRRRLFELRALSVTEKLEDSSLVTKSRRDVARILTELRARQVEDIESKQHHLEKEHAGKPAKK